MKKYMWIKNLKVAKISSKLNILQSKNNGPIKNIGNS